MTTKPRQSQRSGRVLIILALLLGVSAFVRFLGGPAVAVASELATRPILDVATRSDVDAAEEIFPEVAEMLERLRARERLLDDREELLTAKSEALAVMEQTVKSDLADLEAAEKRLAATMMRAQTASEDDLVRLTSVYENMKPDRAAEVFKQMEPSFAAGFMARMRPDAAAAILAGLDSEFAYSISVVLAGRNANVPVEELPE